MIHHANLVIQVQSITVLLVFLIFTKIHLHQNVFQNVSKLDFIESNKKWNMGSVMFHASNVLDKTPIIELPAQTVIFSGRTW